MHLFDLVQIKIFHVKLKAKYYPFNIRIINQRRFRSAPKLTKNMYYARNIII